MEALPHADPGNENWADLAAQMLALQRQRVSEFLAAQQEQLRHAEQTLTSHLDHDAPSEPRDDGETDRLLAEKDRQIEQLEQRVHELSQQQERPAPPADPAALSQIVNADPIIQQAREDLARLRSQWEEKLRQTEIELSLERAKIARQQAEIADKLRLLENRPENAQADATPAGKSSRGRWRARLGLKDPDEK